MRKKSLHTKVDQFNIFTLYSDNISCYLTFLNDPAFVCDQFPPACYDLKGCAWFHDVLKPPSNV